MVATASRASTSTGWAVEARDIRKRYGNAVALDGISITVERGEVFGLLGANGAGKTTLIKILAGAARATGGTARVLALDPATEALVLRRQLGYMPQAAALYEDLSPRDNVRFFAAPHFVPNLDARVDEVLEFTDLRAREREPVYRFSGGMKQRVSLACALVHRPDILFLDEPTAGVDPRLRETFWRHFRDLAASGVTIFLSTHLMDEALLCDRLAIVRDGALLACDTPRSLLARGVTQVSIWRGSTVRREAIADVATRLPQLLRADGLDPDVTRIDLDADTLETIVLRMIEEQGRAEDQGPGSTPGG